MKKEYVKIQLDDDGSYGYEEADTQEMCILGTFLATDVGCYSPSFKKWVLDEKINSFGGNYSSIDKEGEYLFVGCEFELEGPYLKIHKDEFIKILDTWEQFCKTRPREILITKDNDTFTIEGKG